MFEVAEETLMQVAGYCFLICAVLLALMAWVYWK